MKKEQQETINNNNYIGTTLKIENNNGLKKKSPIIFFMFLVISASFFIFLLVRENLESKSDSPAVSQKSNKIFDNLDLQAKAVFIWDVLPQKEIYSKNPEAQLHLASISKIMMALTAVDQLPKGTIISVSSRDLSAEGDSGLMVNEKWTLKNLLDFSLIVSSNDGSTAIANAVSSQKSSDGHSNYFVDLMNQKAKEIGMDQTYFLNPSGLDKNDLTPGGSGSARDISILLEYLLQRYPDLLEATAYPTLSIDSLNGFSHQAENTNDLVLKLPGIIASKTGFTDIAGGNLAIIFEPEPDRPIIIVTLGSSKDGRFKDMEKLYLTTLDYINQ